MTFWALKDDKGVIDIFHYDARYSPKIIEIAIANKYIADVLDKFDAADEKSAMRHAKREFSQ